MAIPSWLTDDLLQKAQSLVGLAHERADTAREAVVKAVLRLDTSTETAEETLEDRVKKDRTPTGLVLLGPPLLQRLLYMTSDELARKEGAEEVCGQTQERMLVRYLQFLLLQLIKRSSRWAALGLSQLVYGYRGSEADLMIQRVAGAVWDERKRAKRDLMNRLAKRFSGLRVIEAAGGEYRHFEPCKDQRQFQPRIWNWLDLLTPWGSEHRFNLRPAASGALEPDWNELDRCHVFIHPSCFGLLVAELGLTPYAQKLRLPQLVRCDNAAPPAPRNGGSVGSAPQKPDTRGDMSSIREEVNRQASRRRNVSGGAFEIRIDGWSAGSLEGFDATVRLPLPTDADVVEVYGHDRDGEVLVATHVLRHTEDGHPGPSAGVVRLGRKHTFAFEVVAAEGPLERPAALCTVRHAQVVWPSRTTRTYFHRGAAAVGLAAASILFVVNQRSRFQLARASADTAALRAREQNLQQELSRLKTEPQVPPTTPAASPAGSSPAPAFVVASLTLMPDQARRRGSVGTPAQVIPENVGSLILFLLLERDVYPAGYSLVIETVDGKAVVPANGLKAESFPDGTRWVRAQVSAQVLRSGTYVVNLMGTTSDGRAIEESNYQFQIVRR